MMARCDVGMGFLELHDTGLSLQKTIVKKGLVVELSQKHGTMCLSHALGLPKIPLHHPYLSSGLAHRHCHSKTCRDSKHDWVSTTRALLAVDKGPAVPKNPRFGPKAAKSRPTSRLGFGFLYQLTIVNSSCSMKGLRRPLKDSRQNTELVQAASFSPS